MTIEEGGKPDASEPSLEPSNEKAKPSPRGRKKRKAKKKSPDSGSRRWEKSWLAAFREHRSVALACESAQIGTTALYKWRKQSPSFRERWDAEVVRRVEVLEQSAWSRATEGWLEPVFHKGVIVGYVRKFSNSLTIFMLKAWGDSRYRFAEQAEDAATEMEKAERIRAEMRAMRASVPGPPPPASVVEVTPSA